MPKFKADMINRNKNIKLFFGFIIVLLLIIAADAAAQDVTVQLHFAINEAVSSAPPAFIDNHLVLSYKGNRRYRFVGAAFRHEDFKTIHPFYRNTNGVYVLIYPVDEKTTDLDYRIVVDGLWITDPENRSISRGSDGITLSNFIVPKKNSPPVSPRIDGETATFVYRGLSGQRVYVYGDFNNWEPYMFRMKEDGDSGTYHYSLRTRQGNYKYKFIVDGTALADPLNDRKTLDTFGETASLMTIGPSY